MLFRIESTEGVTFETHDTLTDLVRTDPHQRHTFKHIAIEHAESPDKPVRVADEAVCFSIARWEEHGWTCLDVTLHDGRPVYHMHQPHTCTSAVNRRCLLAEAISWALSDRIGWNVTNSHVVYAGEGVRSGAVILAHIPGNDVTPWVTCYAMTDGSAVYSHYHGDRDEADADFIERKRRGY